ncbi:MAG: HPr family phosphocarrier protein [Deltaproteobacteria bacterium]|nr:HPr family phosphocarrier protein [Deltaproteobacteria bacterium]
MNQSCEATLKIKNELGLHARAATLFVQLTSKYESTVSVTKDGRSVNGKSIMGVLTLVASKGTEIHILADGPDSEKVIEELRRLVKDKFGEDR